MRKSLKSDTNIILETKYLLKCWFTMDLLFYGLLEIWWQSHVRCLIIWLEFFIETDVTIRLSLVPPCKHHTPKRVLSLGWQKVWQMHHVAIPKETRHPALSFSWQSQIRNTCTNKKKDVWLTPTSACLCSFFLSLHLLAACLFCSLRLFRLWASRGELCSEKL